MFSPYLMAHQRAGAELASEHPRFAFFDDTGTGKTALGIELIKQKKVRTLVVCPLSIITNAWMADLRKFAPDISVANLWDYGRRKAQAPDHQVGIINFERFRTEAGRLQGYEMVLVDESSKAKDPKSKTTKVLIAYCDRVPYVYLFSGTPAPNNELEYWSQMRIIDPAILGKSYYAFRNKFCYPSGFGGYTWKLRDGRRAEFLDKLSEKSRVVRKQDVLDLPERTFNVRDIYLTPAEMEAYRTMERDLLLEIGDQEAMAATAAVKAMKLRQGTSGFYYTTEGAPLVAGPTKLQSLKELLQEIGNHQVVIWFQFRHEGDQIGEMLGHSYGRIDGSSGSQTWKDGLVQDFIRGDLKYLIAHPASLGHGVTLVNCSYTIYYSLSHSHELHTQSQDRIYRHGQRNACTYYYLLAPGTVDVEILQALEHKADVAEAVFRYIKNNR